MIYALPYIVITLFCGVLAIIEHERGKEKTCQYLDVACVTVIFLFFGFRGFVFTDWTNYYSAFNSCTFSDLSLIPQKGWEYEVGFTLLMLICKSLINDYQFLVIVTTAIDLALLLRFLHRRVNNLPLALMIFLSMGGLIMIVNLLRNSIAILIFINALDYLERRRPIPYFILCLLALSFHWSSIIYFPLYFFLHKKINKWVFLGIFIAGNSVLLLGIPLLTSIISLFLNSIDGLISYKIEAYSTIFDYSSKISIGMIERLLTGTLVFCYYDRLKSRREENVVFINSMLLYFTMFFMLSQFDEVARRMSNLFQYSYWIIWYDLIRCFFYHNNRKLFIAFLGIYCILKIYGSAHLELNSYDNVLTGAKSYEQRLFEYNKMSEEK